MIRIEDDCVDCGLHCLGNSCPYKNVFHFYCDGCGYEEDLYHYDGKQLCINCIVKKLRKVKAEDYE